ncbi:hypothetical protein BN439_1980 [Erwinia amylovora Ea644]|nr:hypothetical protein BN439_1980 [Erwinia amylovora Ea644]
MSDNNMKSNSWKRIEEAKIIYLLAIQINYVKGFTYF